VVSLRKVLQARVQALQAEIEMLLKTYQQERLQTQMQLAQELAAFIDALRTDVQTYLSELDLARQDRARQLRQMLDGDRNRRIAEVDAMFQELVEFRAELRQYCIDLRTLVWGGATTTEPLPLRPPITPPPVAKYQPIQPQPAKPAKPTNVQPPTVQPKAAVPKVSQPRVTEPTPVAPVIFAEADLPVELTSPELDTLAMDVASPAAQSAQKDLADLEKDIYDYIRQIKGARLNEIEAALGINRFQAVDALRSLIKNT
jgi:hypothetical protein